MSELKKNLFKNVSQSKSITLFLAPPTIDSNHSKHDFLHFFYSLHVDIGMEFFFIINFNSIRFFLCFLNL